MTWIKMNHALLTSPEVVRISSALEADRLRTVGALYVLWCCADMHAEYLPEGSGLLPGYTLSAVDATVNWPGFAEAVAKAGWLVPAENGLILPHFERHNGASAKRRAMDLERKKSVRKMSASKADKMRRPLLSSSLLSSSVESLSPEEGTGEKPSEPFITPPSAFPPVSVSSLLPEQRWQPMATRQVLVSLPKRCQVNPRKFWRACGEALDRIQSGAERTPARGKPESECIAWLAMRARQYAESDIGKTQYAVMGWRWLEDSRYLDPPEAWTRGEEADAPRRTVEQALAEAKGKNNGHA